MIKLVTKEESQIIDLYRKIKDPYNKYLTVEYMRLNAKLETGKDEQIPTALEKCETIYTACNSISLDIKENFPEEEQDRALADLTESMKKDMREAYYGSKTR